jgi:hypothetical protein
MFNDIPFSEDYELPLLDFETLNDEAEALDLAANEESRLFSDAFLEERGIRPPDGLPVTVSVRRFIDGTYDVSIAEGHIEDRIGLHVFWPVENLSSWWDHNLTEGHLPTLE